VRPPDPSLMDTFQRHLNVAPRHPQSLRNLDRLIALPGVEDDATIPLRTRHRRHCGTPRHMLRVQRGIAGNFIRRMAGHELMVKLHCPLKPMNRRRNRRMRTPKNGGMQRETGKDRQDQKIANPLVAGRIRPGVLSVVWLSRVGSQGHRK
jgi:hypothetical protein